MVGILADSAYSPGMRAERELQIGGPAVPGLRTLHKDPTPMKLLYLIAMAGLLLPACSVDKHSYTSTPFRPTSVDLVAPQAGVVWTMDIPVNHTLKIDLDRPGDIEVFSNDPEKSPTRMHWKLVALNTGARTDSGNEVLPGIPLYIKMRFRPAPEWPADFVPPGQDDAPTAIEVIETP